MNNPSTTPNEVIHTIAYDSITGLYAPSDNPSIVGTMHFERINVVPLPTGIILLLTALITLVTNVKLRSLKRG